MTKNTAEERSLALQLEEARALALSGRVAEAAELFRKAIARLRTTPSPRLDQAGRPTSEIGPDNPAVAERRVHVGW